MIAAYSRTFCGTCNRIRITPDGGFKTCLYDNGVFNIKNLLRSGYTDEMLKNELISKLNKRPLNGWEAADLRAKESGSLESMATIGG